MKLKKKLRNFFTLTRKANGGFTLVELIVVIAILGILSGAGAVGYSGYVKSADKKADQVLVGNIIRAIETGTYSTMFVNDDSFKMGELAYPVGFVALSTNNGAQVVTSSTEIFPATTDECEFETVTVAVVKGENKTTHCSNSFTIPIINYTIGCKETTTDIIYSIQKNVTITYCKTHSTNESAIPVALTADTSYITSVKSTKDVDCKLSGRNVQHTSWTKTTDTLAAGTLVTNGETRGFYKLKADGMCEAAYGNQHGTFGTPQIGNASAGDPIYDSITAAFGDVSNLKLTYNGWLSDEGVDYSTFYIASTEVMGKVQSLSSLLIIGEGLAKLAGESLGLAGNYDNGEEVLSGVAQFVVETFPTEDAWLVEWDLAANDSWSGQRGFGLPGRETYSAARMGYNTAFGAYLDACKIDSKYTNLIKNYYTAELFGVGLPGLINTSAFTDDASGLKQDFIDAGDVNAGQKGSVFNQCADLYEKYKDSAACEENGRVLYRTLSTFNETSDEANTYANVHGGTIYDYYNGYINEISELYSKAQTAAAGGIVIIVTVEQGEVSCVVSPSVADPRNK